MALLEQKVLILEQKIDKLQKSIEELKCYKARKKRTPTRYALFMQKFFNHPDVVNMNSNDIMKYLAGLWQKTKEPKPATENLFLNFHFC